MPVIAIGLDRCKIMPPIALGGWARVSSGSTSAVTRAPPCGRPAIHTVPVGMASAFDALRYGTHSAVADLRPAVEHAADHDLRVAPLPRGTRWATTRSRYHRPRAPLRGEPGAGRHHAAIEGGRAVGPARAERRGQDDAAAPPGDRHAALVRQPPASTGSTRRATRTWCASASPTCPTPPACTTTSPRARTSTSPPPCSARPIGACASSARWPTSGSPTEPATGSAASPPACASDSPSAGSCSAARRSCCSTSRSPPSTPRAWAWWSSCSTRGTRSASR